MTKSEFYKAVSKVMKSVAIRKGIKFTTPYGASYDVFSVDEFEGWDELAKELGVTPDEPPLKRLTRLVPTVGNQAMDLDEVYTRTADYIEFLQQRLGIKLQHHNNNEATT